MMKSLPRPPKIRSRPLPPCDDVVAVVAVEDVGRADIGAAVGDDVVAVAADDVVDAVAAFDAVVAAVAPERVVAVAGDRGVVARCGAAEDDMLAAGEAQVVRCRRRRQQIVAHRPSG